jgi:hypothetical protein
VNDRECLVDGGARAEAHPARRTSALHIIPSDIPDHTASDVFSLAVARRLLAD